MKRLAALFSCLFLCMAAAVQADQLRIATYNVHYDNFDSDQMIDAIRESDADIVCIQEASKRTIDVMRDRLSDRFMAISHQGQFGFLSTRTPDSVTLHTGDRIDTALFTFDDRQLRVVNVHLTPIKTAVQPNLLQLIGAIANSERAHTEEIATILGTLDAKSPTIVLGDFNATSKSGALANLRAAGFTDSLASVHPDADQHATWDWQTMLKLESKKFNSDSLGVMNVGGGLQAGLRIDYIFHTNHFQTVTSEVIRRPGSDHFLVVSELKW